MPTPTKYTYSLASDFPASGINSARMVDDVASSSIVTAIDRIDTSGDVVDIWFKDALSAADKTTLDNDATGPSGGLIAAHTGEPLDSAPAEVVVVEENVKTGGHYQTKSIEADVPAGAGWHTLVDHSWPFPISMLSANARIRSNSDKDEIAVLIAPDTVTGTITADVAASATVIDVAQSVIDNVSLGYCLKLSDGTNEDDLGRVVAIDKGAKQVTVETATVNAFAAATPTYVKQTIQMAPHVELTDGHIMSIGESKIGGSHIPANTVIRLRYNNVPGGGTKRFSVCFEYLY